MLTVIALSVFTIFMANMIYYYILKNHDSSIISALIYSSPVFTLIIAHLFLKERLDIYGVSGIFAIIIGVILISQNKSIYMKSGKN
jgi:drug/metabolite transporter (DMT)-like permease